ncbi:SET domain-containing protein [Hypoxylon sp. FL0890]|nr:SET domain-containing protein [Hypoxylon sp. FL0890]
MNGTKPQGMIKIRRLGSTGSEAVFATTDIPRGTRLAAEIPLVIVPPVSEKEELADFCKAIDQLPEDKLAEIAELLCRASLAESIKNNEYVRYQVRGFYKAKKWKDGQGNLRQGKKLQKFVKRTLYLYAIYLMNNVQLGPGGKYGSGIFSLYSRISHSCVPNAHSSWNPTMERLTIHATRDLKTGDQIFVDYTGNVCRTRQQRAFSLFTKWGITCKCAACTDPKIDQLRYRMLVVDQALAAYTCGASREPNFSAVHRIPQIETAKKALEAAEELVQLLKRQDLNGMELCRVFRECSQYAFDDGAFGKAIDYARKELELEKLLLGTETAHLKDDFQGAKYWVKHIQKKITKTHFG